MHLTVPCVTTPPAGIPPSQGSAARERGRNKEERKKPSTGL